MALTSSEKLEGASLQSKLSIVLAFSVRCVIPFDCRKSDSAKGFLPGAEVKKNGALNAGLREYNGFPKRVAPSSDLIFQLTNSLACNGCKTS